MKFFGKKGFTFTELIVAITISTFLLVVIFTFVADSITVLSETTRKSKLLVSFYEFVVRFDNYRNKFPTVNIVKDFSPGFGYDVVLLKTFDNKLGVIFGIINAETMMLDPSSNYNNFGSKMLGSRELTQTEIISLLTTPDDVYTYRFYEDKIFDGLVAKSFQADLYNQNNIVDVNIGFLLSEWASSEITNWGQIPVSDVYNVNLNF